MKIVRFIAILLLGLSITNGAYAGEKLPDAVHSRASVPLVEMGSSTYRSYGFRVYRASLWTADGKNWDKQKPYALALRYMRDVDKDTLVDTVTDNLRGQNVADDAAIKRWHDFLNKILTDVKEGDTVTTLYLPGKKSPIFMNDKVVGEMDDQTFIAAYFNIWLGKDADSDMRNELLAQR